MQNGAPPDISPDELVMQLSSREQPSRVVDFPAKPGASNTSGQLRIIILPAMEKTKAKSEAGKITRNQLKVDLGREPTVDDLSTDYAREMLNDVLVASLICRFSRSRDPIGEVGENRRVTYGRIFKSPEWVLNNFSSDEVALLMMEYQILEVEEGPREQILLDDPFILQMWIDKAKKGMWTLGPFVSLAFLDLAELARFALKRIEEAQSLGCNILDPQFLNSLPSGTSPHVTSGSDITSSGEPPASSAHTPIPETLTPAQAKARAKQLREKL
jgi:hypothetical protein